MNDSGNDFQRALIAALRNDLALTGLVAGRVYDRVPPAPTFPYVALGESADDQDAVGEGVDAYVHDFLLEAWSNATTIAEAADISDALFDALDDAVLAVGDTAVGDIRHVRTSFPRDAMLRAQGVEHVRVQFRAHVEDGARTLQPRPSAMFTSLGLMGVSIMRRGTFLPKAVA